MLVLDLSVNGICTMPQLYWGIVLRRDTSISVSTDIPGIPPSGSIEREFRTTAAQNTDTCSKSEPTRSLSNTSHDPLQELEQSLRKFPSPQEAAPGRALVPSRVSAPLQ
jgi:hypothetical protein